jgi:hypothetical protein
MALEVEIKQKALLGVDKLDIINNMGTQLHVTRINLLEEPGIPVFTFKNIMANKNTILQQGESWEPSRKKFKTSKYEKIETILLERFCQKWAMNIPIADPMLRQKAEEIALELNIDFKVLNGRMDGLID